MALPNAFKAGQRLSAEALTSMVQEIARSGNLSGGAPLAVGGGPGGNFLSASVERWFWIKLTGGGTGGVYSWTEQYPDTSGAWVTGVDSGTTSSDPAYESNGNAAVTLSPAPIVLARRELQSNSVVFTSGNC